MKIRPVLLLVRKLKASAFYAGGMQQLCSPWTEITTFRYSWFSTFPCRFQFLSLSQAFLHVLTFSSTELLLAFLLLLSLFLSFSILLFFSFVSFLWSLKFVLYCSITSFSESFFLCLILLIPFSLSSFQSSQAIFFLSSILFVQPTTTFLSGSPKPVASSLPFLQELTSISTPQMGSSSWPAPYCLHITLSTSPVLPLLGHGL